MAKHFVFRLTDETAALILTALEREFVRSDSEQKKKIAGVTFRLRRKLQNLNITRRDLNQ